jgi:hypothetical protein
MAKRRDVYNSMTWDIDWFDNEWLNEEFNERDNIISEINDNLDNLEITVSWIQTDVWNLQIDVSNIFSKFSAWYTWTFIVDWKTLTFNEWLLTSVI